VREQLVEAAAVVFARHGYANTTVEQIAEQAGFSKGAVYSNYDGKQDLFFELLDARIEAREDFADEGRTGSSVGDRLREAALADPGWLRLLIQFWAHAVEEPTVLARLQERRAELRRYVAGALEHRAETTGQSLVLPAEQLAAVVIALVNGLAMEDLDGQPGSALLPSVLPLLLGDLDPR
jgi:AcrR family transcriptional regulator